MLGEFILPPKLSGKHGMGGERVSKHVSRVTTECLRKAQFRIL